MKITIKSYTHLINKKVKRNEKKKKIQQFIYTGNEKRMKIIKVGARSIGFNINLK